MAQILLQKFEVATANVMKDLKDVEMLNDLEAKTQQPKERIVLVGGVTTFLLIYGLLGPAVVW